MREELVEHEEKNNIKHTSQMCKFLSQQNIQIAKDKLSHQQEIESKDQRISLLEEQIQKLQLIVQTTVLKSGEFIFQIHDFNTSVNSYTSPAHVFFGCRWYLDIFPISNKNSNYLTARLRCVPLVGHNDWSIFVEFCIEIAAEAATASVVYRGAQEYTRKQDSFSWDYFIAHEALFSPRLKLLSDDGDLAFKVTIDIMNIKKSSTR